MALIRDPSKDVITAGATTLTSGATVAAALVALATGIEPIWKAIFGDQQPSQAVRAAIIVAAIGAWALVAAVDLIARAWVTSQTHPQIAPAPPGLSGSYLGGGGSQPWTVVGVRSSAIAQDRPEFLIVHGSFGARWVPAEQMDFSAPAASS